MRVSRSAKIFAVLAFAAVPARAQCEPPDAAVPAVHDSLLVTTQWLAPTSATPTW